MEKDFDLAAGLERLLFGTSLADKLAAIPVRGHWKPSAPCGIPEGPGRPDSLSWPKRGTRVRSDFPKPGELSDPKRRAAALHFFANHELLALELMALALLRFPTAPPRWRQGVLATLADEQRHLRLYVERSQSLGGELGEQPVNRFFWDAIAACRDPEQFNALMACTFEQANLDHAIWYGRAFEQHGDAASASIMERIFHDEVRHVRHGVLWLRRFSEPKGSLYDHWKARIEPILAPEHAKGRGPHRAARARTGLDDEYISRLLAERGTRSAALEVLLYLAGTEGVGEGATTPPPALTPIEAALERDLELLPALVAPSHAVTLVSKEPSPDFRMRLAKLGLAPGPTVEMPPPPRRGIVCRSLADRWPGAPIAALRPTVSGERADRILGPLEPWLTPQGRSTWPSSVTHTRAANKSWAALHRQSLEQHLRGTAELAPMLPAERSAAAEILRSECELDAALRRARERGERRLVVKADQGQAGRGNRRLDPRTISASERSWCVSALRSGPLTLERWRERVADLSLHFDIQTSDRDAGLQVRPLGGLRFLTDRRGQFLGALLGPEVHDLERPYRAAIQRTGALSPRGGSLGRATAAWLQAVLPPATRGPLGVDMMFARGAEGRPELLPLVECNLRWSFGRFALELRRRLPRDVRGLWFLEVRAATNPKAKLIDPQAFPPAQLGVDGHLRSGLVPTNDPELQPRFQGWLAVGAAFESPFVQQLLSSARSLLSPPA